MIKQIILILTMFCIIIPLVNADISYSAGPPPTITIIGNETFCNVTDPCTFDEIHTLSEANGWGCSIKTGDSAYTWSCKLIFGNNADWTYFEDTAKSIHWNTTATPAQGNAFIVGLRNSSLTFGRILDEGAKTTDDGILFTGPSEATYWTYGVQLSADVGGDKAHVYYYGTTVMTGANVNVLYHVYNGRMWNTYGIGFAQWTVMIDSDIYNHMQVGPGSGWGIRQPRGTNITRATILDVAEAIYFQATGGTVDDVYTRASTRFARAYFVTNQPMIIRDADSDTYAVAWNLQSTKPSTYNLTLQYSLNLHLVNDTGDDLEGATVQLIDNLGNIVLSDTTNASGQLTNGPQFVNYSVYAPHSYIAGDPECDSGWGDFCIMNEGEVIYSPHILNITKTNHNDVIIRNLTMNEKKRLELSMDYQGDWNYSQPLGWKILNTSDVTILKLSRDGNLAIAGELYENTNSPPPGDEVAFQMKDLFYLTHSGDLYLDGKFYYKEAIGGFGLLFVLIIYTVYTNRRKLNVWKR